MNDLLFSAAIISAGLNIYGAQIGCGVFRAQVNHGNEIRFYDNDRIGGSGLNGWFCFRDGEILASGSTLADVAPYAGPMCSAGDDDGATCARVGVGDCWAVANYRAIFQRENCAIGQVAMYATTVCAVAFSPLYVGGYPCHENINASPADDFFTYSTPADPGMMPWRCSQPDVALDFARALAPAGNGERWWCETTTGSYGVQMILIGFTIGKAGEAHRDREDAIMESVCSALRAIGLDAAKNYQHGWITLTDHKRPYRVPVLPAEFRA